jgi:hypothetical protein
MTANESMADDPVQPPANPWAPVLRQELWLTVPDDGAVIAGDFRSAVGEPPD